jgi:iron complex outermembrane recepter protein
VRLAWQPAPQHLAWAALSRAVRAPSRIDRDLFLPGVPPHTILAGGPGFESEIADVLEVGYRGQLSADLSLSATAFRHRFDRLRSYELVDGRPAWSNGNEGTTTGFEAWATWRLAPSLRLTLGGFAMDQDFRTKPGRRDLAGLAQLGNDPNLSVRANLQWDPSPVHEVDIELRHEGRLPDPVVPKYTVADIRLGWAISPQGRTWLRVENVTDRRHAEFGDPATRAVFGRTWLLGLSWAL